MLLPNALHIAPFSTHREMIEMLYKTDDNFKTLCDDYAISKANVEVHTGAMLESMRFKMEYQQLAHELEEEIIEYVQKIS